MKRPKPNNVVKLPERLCLTLAEWMRRDLEPRDHLLGELFTTTSRIIFSADTGSGKTMIAVAIAVALGLGKGFLHWKSKRKARVLLMDWELPRDETQNRIEMACQWFRIEPSEARRQISVLNHEDVENMSPLDTEAGKKWLDDFIETYGPFDFIIFDNLQALCEGIMKEEEGWKEMVPYMLSLTKRRIGQLWIHHTGHDKTRGYGTKTREWKMDTVIVGTAVTKDHVNTVLNFDTKATYRNDKNYLDFQNVQVELVNGVWTHKEPEEAAKGRPNKAEQIALAALRQLGGKAALDVWRSQSYELGISTSSTESSRRTAFRRALGSLLESEKVIKSGKHGVEHEDDEYSIPG